MGATLSTGSYFSFDPFIKDKVGLYLNSHLLIFPEFCGAHEYYEIMGGQSLYKVT